MLEGVWNQAQAGGVAQAEEPAPATRESDRQVTAAHPGAVLDHVVAEFPEHPGGHELGPVRHAERMVGRVAGEGPHPELAVGVEGRAPEDVAGIPHVVGIRLPSTRQGIDQVLEEPYAPVSPGQREDPGVEASLLLCRHLHPECLQQVVGDVAVDQHGGDLPAFCDHPVGVRGLVDRRGEGHEAEPVGTGVHPVDRLAAPLFVEVLTYEAGRPPVRHGPSEHRATEAVPGEAGRSEHLGLHHDLGRAQGGGAGVQLRLKSINDRVDRHHRSTGQPWNPCRTAAG